MSLKSLLATASDTFKTMLDGYIGLSNAHLLLDIAGLLSIAGIIIGIYKRYNKP